MRVLDLELVKQTVKELGIEACENIGEDILTKLRKALKEEQSPLGREVLQQIIINDEIAQKERVPMCQDTGIVVVFVELGSQVVFEGDIYEAINEGVAEAYVEGNLRKSVVAHPLVRKNTGTNAPAVTHIKIVPGTDVKITVAPKGGGSENMSLVKMLIPADGVEGIKKLVLKTIFESGGKPCPPIVVGIGLGGTFEKAALLAKEALMRDLGDKSDDPVIAKLEEELLEEINKLGVGPMGFGGTTTALGVKINTYPCHIASLPVAINIQCHAARHKSRVI
ncbi:MAG: fumarate hydratase [Acholeplasmataceae bacterium]|nr:fumarate hydratase [Acholeplasmataceae bacterium]